MKYYLSLGLGLVFCIQLLSQEYYFTLSNDHFPVNQTGINSMDIESLDVDSDGDVDLVIAAEYNRNLLLFNDGFGQFSEDPERIFPEKNLNDGFQGEDSEDIGYGDFDKDGDLDLIVVSEDTPFHELLINDSTGLFTFASFNFQNSMGNAVAVMDVNSDTYLDIIIGNTGQNQVYLNNQDLTFSLDPDRWPINFEGTQDLKLTDLDDDGDLDVIEGIDQGANNILINEDGYFVEENGRLPETGLTLETRKITLGDINGDSHVDMFVSTVNFIGTANLQNRLYLNDGNGFFSDVTDSHLPVYTQFTLDAVFIDYDLDGDEDLICTDLQNPSGSQRAFDNNGGVFTENEDDVFPNFTLNNGIGIHAADFNNDGYTDLYFGNFQESDDMLFFNENAVGVRELSKSRVEIFPNPASDFLRISLPHIPEDNIESLNIYNLQGKSLLHMQAAQLVQSTNGIEINVGHLSEGTYQLLLKTNGVDQYVEQLIVIQR